MFSVVLDDDVPVERDQVMAELRTRQIETRPIVVPIHLLPPYREIAGPGVFPFAERVARRGINLPTWAKLARDDVRYVCDSLLKAVRLRAGVGV
jgi:perosamine synthetase